MSPLTNLTFAPAPTITMVSNVIVVNIKGLLLTGMPVPFHWTCLLLELNCPRVKEPYAQPVPLKNVMLEYKGPIKLEGESQDFTTLRLEEPEHKASQAVTPKLEEYSKCSIVLEDSDCDTSLQSATVAPLPCTVLTWDNGNPQAKEGTPS
ncbi:hypothetical protein F5J12DRAFT_786321 [Pisolithus orientalis]|uniref:uncharacterized protein n=1 Tax=Pisolithus orientalis TaxID=936130 RepID=UPI002224047E|nr:uncharacterized protein F5J12DRAFT_786321 [Pisolithus orientalis]KAI5991677.1 hypothetical protein F5J12DRAFT_786321 [Pisolithus orientalis]